MSNVTQLRGRPRDAALTDAIRRAVLELAAEAGSLEGVTMRAVAERAGVGLPSLYRRWASKGELLTDAVTAASAAAAPTPDTGSLRGDLLALATGTATGLAGSGAGAAWLTLALHSSGPDSAELREQVQQARRRANRAVVRRAIDRGELPASTDADLLLDLLLGPLWLEQLTQARPATSTKIRAVVDAVLRSFAPAQQQATGARRSRR